MSRTILVINGPNLNLLGTRQPEVYGSATLADVEKLCRDTAAAAGASAACFQSNDEGAIIERIHAARGKVDALVVNAGAYTHTSIAIRDAIAGVDIPLWEVHISNIHAREEFRHNSYLSGIAKGVICGFGIAGYEYAIRAALEHADG